MNNTDQLSTGVPLENSASTSVLEQAIRERAYELYEQRGKQDGQAEEDWLRAELELRSETPQDLPA